MDTQNSSITADDITTTIIGHPISTLEFQGLQTEMTHSIVLDLAPSGCSNDDILAEILGALRMSVVLDRQTSSSRICWLSGKLHDSKVLLVIDSMKDGAIHRLSLDVWSDLQGIGYAIQNALANTRVGEVREDFGLIDADWSLDYDDAQGTSLVVTIIPNSLLAGESVFFEIDYQGLVSESFEASMPHERERLSVALDLNGVYALWNNNLDDSYLAVILSDASWKDSGQYHQLRFSWDSAVRQQTQKRLSSGKRFSNIDEFTNSLHMQSNSNALQIFIEFCLRSDLRGCEGQRISSHCSRAVILTGLVICFNPARGLSGYLELVTGDNSLSLLADLGSHRTWRDHISQIVQLSTDFKPQTGTLKQPSRHRAPGRPPTQLVPTIHPARLFEQFLEDPENLVCQYCRFKE